MSKEMENFSCLSNINPKEHVTWNAKVFLTFDLDWAHDDVIRDTIEIVREAGVASTWFITHETPMLEEIRSLKNSELGIHPSFNPFLDGSMAREGIGVENVLLDLMRIVPEAKAVRSHSLFQSERLLDIFKDVGLTHVSNHFVPHKVGISFEPFQVWSNLTIVPHCWQDNVSLRMDLPFPSRKELEVGFHTFDFHPIHVYLNTEDLDRYEKSRLYHQNPKELIKWRHEGSGVGKRLQELLDLRKNNKF